MNQTKREKISNAILLIGMALVIAVFIYGSFFMT